ncbi:MAG: YceI family protein [Weeksellaceae bacterium]|nr:YceI family protein [Weeksellaceae bacterium]
MKKTVFFLSFFLATAFCFAQKYMTKTGKIHFEASVPLFEDVDATNAASVAVLNAATGDIASVAMTKSFKFKVALMEEHFNENYAESSKYPKATFSGKILNFNLNELSASSSNYTISGTLNFHGANNKVTSIAAIYTREGKIYITGKFVARPADYKVTIPKMVTKKIAENVKVDYHFELVKQ